MRVLNIGSEVQLLHLRGAFLKALGFAVVSVHEVLPALHELQFAGRPYDVAVLCHTLSNANKLLLDSAIQDIASKPIIVELYLATSPVTSGIALDAAAHFPKLMVAWAPSSSMWPELEVDHCAFFSPLDAFSIEAAKPSN
jgi:hypothetical protein